MGCPAAAGSAVGAAGAASNTPTLPDVPAAPLLTVDDALPPTGADGAACPQPHSRDAKSADDSKIAFPLFIVDSFTA